MKEAAMAEVAEEQARAERYAEGYHDGFSDGYDRALADIKKLKSVAAEELAISQVRESKTIPGAVEY
jgi:flagellar biosynthesis/type III secretory pathway protein FliH